MIDYIDVEIQATHRPFGSKGRVFNPETGVLSRQRLWQGISLVGGVRFEARSLNQGETMRFRGCPAKAHLGHNLFGSDDLLECVIRIARAVFRAQGLPFTGEITKKLRKGRFRLHEVHINYLFWIGRGRAMGVIDELRRSLPSRIDPRIRFRGAQLTLWEDRRSGSWSLYDKHRELVDKRRRSLRALNARNPGFLGIGLFPRLLSTADECIRVELRMKKKMLGGYQSGKAWRKDTARSLFFAQLKEIPFPAHPPQLKIILEGRDKWQLGPLLRLWELGEDPRACFAPNTLRTKAKKLLKVGNVDVRSPRQLTSAFPSFGEIFREGNVCFGLRRPKPVRKRFKANANA